jgi:hypothetical protein
MARTIIWKSPSQDTITNVEIYKSATKFGTYNLIDTIDATSDGDPKDASNDWVTTYTDNSGTFTDWYRIRFYDGTNYSDLSDPIGAIPAYLCTIDDVKEVIDATGRFSDDEILTAIQEEEDVIYDEAGTPIIAVKSLIDRIGSEYDDTYFVGEENIYRIDKIFLGTATKQELFPDDHYKALPKLGMLRVLPVASGGPELGDGMEIEMRYVPKIYNRYATYRVAKRLLDKTDYLIGGSTTRETEVIDRRLSEVEKRLRDRVGIRLSSDYTYYDPVYGVNRKTIRQDHVRNRYVSSVYWGQ